MQRQLVQLESGPLEYVDSGGPGPVIVLLHGALMDEAMWSGVVEHLCPRFRCVVPVLPMGAHRLPMPAADVTPQGQARLVVDLLDALELSGVVLVGNDTGGAIAQLLVAARPGRLAALVLVSCDAFENFPPGLPGRTMAVASAMPGGLRLAMLSLRIPALRRLPITFGWMSIRPIDTAVFGRWLDAYHSEPGVRRDLRRMMRGVDDHQLVRAAEGLRAFPGPALIVWAGQDRVMPREHAHRLVAALPHAHLEVVEDSYTLVPLDQPVALADLIDRFARAVGDEESDIQAPQHRPLPPPRTAPSPPPDARRHPNERTAP